MRQLFLLNLIVLGLLCLIGWFDEARPAEIASPIFVNMEVIKQIESSGNALAYNKAGNAYGWFQITPVCLEDFNRANNEHYSVEELFDPQINSRVAYWYFENRLPQLLRHFGLKDSVHNRIIAYNAGIKRLMSGVLPLETKKYLARYDRLVSN